MRVSRWGNSLAVRLPRELVERIGLAEGDEVEVMVVGERAVTLIKREDANCFLAQLWTLQRPATPGFRWSREEANERRRV